MNSIFYDDVYSEFIGVISKDGIVGFDYVGGGAGQSYSDYKFFTTDEDYIFDYVFEVYGTYIDKSREYNDLEYFVDLLFDINEEYVLFDDVNLQKLKKIKCILNDLESLKNSIEEDIDNIKNNNYLDLCEIDIDYKKVNNIIVGIKEEDIQEMFRNLKDIVEAINEEIEYAINDDEEEV